MANIDKVIKGLTYCSQGIGMCGREQCPYYGISDLNKDSTCRIELEKDAIELLKAQVEPKQQEAKALSLEELDEIYQKQDSHVWPFDTPPYMWITVNPDVRLSQGDWICWRDIVSCLENRSSFYIKENYGKAWLLWTRQPTSEQVRAVKWVADVESVIKGLEFVLEESGWDSDKTFSEELRINYVTDAITLLKQQEPVAPDVDSEGTCSCGNCGTTVGYYPVGSNVPDKGCEYCPECGRKVKWDG